MFEALTFNLRPDLVRHEEMAGKKYLVCPLVMMTHGVHAGSKGPMYYPEDELAKASPAWNHKPIVVYHPEKGTATDPAVLHNRFTGILLNTVYDGKQRTEAWFEESRIDVVDKRVREAIENQKMMEVSTGLYLDVEWKKGEWNGEKYIGIARNHRPDHLALLPDKVGACSIKDGAGLFQLNEVGLSLLLNTKESLAKGLVATALTERRVREHIHNELSHSALYSALHTALRQKYANGDGYVWMGYMEDVFDGYFIYCDGMGGTWRQDYTASDTGVALDGDPEQVVRSVQYVSANNATIQKENNMAKAKKETVDKVIANKATKFTEADREILSNMDESIVERLAAVEAPAPAAPPAAPPATPPAVTPTANQDQQTFEALLAKAPAAIQRVIANGIAMEKMEREKLIGVITKAPGAIYNAEELKDRDINDLFKLAQLAQAATMPAANQQHGLTQPNYLGLGLPVANVGGGKGEEEEAPMSFPVMNFEKKKAG